MNPRTIPTPLGTPGRMDGMVSGVRAAGLLFFSALRGRDPFTDQIPEDTEAQARVAFASLETLLKSVGATLADVVKVTVYFGDLKYRAAFHRVWMEFFPENPPARLAVQVADANASPGGNAHFVLEVVAVDREFLGSFPSAGTDAL